MKPCRCWMCTGRAALLALAAASCAADDVEVPLERFTPRPVHVQASSLLPDECLAALDDAVAFWRAQGVSMELTVVDPGTPSLNGIAVPGVVGVLPGKLATAPNIVHGETVYYHSVGGDILAAEITLASCDARAVRHEVGHSLMGPRHEPARWNVMNGELRDVGYELTDEQRADVADETLGTLLSE